MRTLAFAALAFTGALLAERALPALDVTRTERLIDNALVFVPDGGQIKAASTGFEEVAADLLWVRAVLIFGERYESASGGEWTDWLARMILAVNTLDPRWRTAYFYGGTMLRVSGDVDAADRVFTLAVAHLPDDWYFPFSLGMNAYLYRSDPATAARWIEQAATTPGAPKWYAAAAAAMLREAGAREAAIHYLQDLVASTQDPAVLADAKLQLSRLRHDELVDSWKDRCRTFRAETGRRLTSPAELEALVGQPLPPNPRADDWVVGGDGVVRGEGAEAERYRRVLKAEWKHIGRD